MNYVCLLLFSVFITLSLCVCLCEYMTYMCDGEVFNVLHIGHNITLAGRGRLEYMRRFLKLDKYFFSVWYVMDILIVTMVRMNVVVTEE